jgi:hypothetical protein
VLAADAASLAGAAAAVDACFAAALWEVPAR